MKKSQLFTLLVTLNLVNEKNYVMEVEYPMAVREDKKILPAEMQKTDASALRKYYNGIPDSVNSRKPKRFNSVIVNMLSNTTRTSDNISSYDKYLLGMAYLNGVDVEINNERAVQLLTESAEAERTEAIEKLVDIYYYGGSVSVDYHKALKWQKYLVEIYQRQSVDEEVLADSLGYLGVLYNQITEYDTALEYYEESLAISEKV